MAELRRRGLGAAVALGSAEPQQAIEQCAPHEHFGALPGERARREPLAEGALEAGDGGLAEAAAMIVDLLLPAPAPNPSDAANVLIAIERRSPTVAVLPDPGPPGPAARARRGEDRARALGARGDGLGAAPLVVGAVARDLPQRRAP